MAISTPGTTTSETVGTEPGTHTQRLVDIATDDPSGVTVSRAVRPPVAVPNKRLADGFGEAFLVWRCLDCGTLGSLDSLPTRCGCGAGREHLAYVTED